MATCGRDAPPSLPLQSRLGQKSSTARAYTCTFNRYRQRGPLLSMLQYSLRRVRAIDIDMDTFPAHSSSDISLTYHSSECLMIAEHAKSCAGLAGPGHQG